MVDAQIPSKAVADATDLRQPVRLQLEDLNLLGNAADTAKADGIGAAFAGPPQSVAVIEAGATAAAKWWAAGFGASVIATWGTLVKWWGGQESNIKVAALVGAALVTAALVLSIGYLLASDVRGRAAASVATVDARARLLPTGVRAKNHDRPAGDEDGWLAVAVERHANGALKYLLVKGSAEATVPASKLEFV